jgi:oligoribonuclease NrnB/cAMP/cGMP phosphodiesterase (DHH superfamily)
MQQVDLIVYHGGCPDGWCAAYVAKKVYPSAALFPATFGKELPDVAGKSVLVVDFSWKRQVTLELTAKAKELFIIDHHQTAEKELAGLPNCLFDMKRSGAGLTWDYLFPGLPRPWYVDYVEDRDLWTWKLPNSRAISAFLMAQPMTAEGWLTIELTSDFEAALQGEGIVQHIDQYVGKVAAEAQKGYLFWDGTKTVSVINAAYPNISDACHKLCEDGADIGMGWFQRGDGQVQFSLRSVGDLDVSEIARFYGGGGHKNAAGFQLPLVAAIGLITEITGKE